MLSDQPVCLFGLHQSLPVQSKLMMHRNKLCSFVNQIAEVLDNTFLMTCFGAQEIKIVLRCYTVGSTVALHLEGSGFESLPRVFLHEFPPGTHFILRCEYVCAWLFICQSLFCSAIDWRPVEGVSCISPVDRWR